MKDVLIRAAVQGDVPAIVELLWDDPQGRIRESNASDDAMVYQRAFTEITGDPNSDLFVACFEERVVGCLLLTIIPGLSYRGSKRALIEDVRVAPDLRSKGIGQDLIQYAERKARRLECALVELFAHTERDAAHRFYEGQGYAATHRGFRKRLR